MKKRIVGFFLILSCIFSFSIPSFGNSAQSYWEGYDSHGPITTDEDCPLIVMQEDLTFHIKTFPLFPTSLEDITSYVSAKYTFYNPAAYDVTATLMFPFGRPYHMEVGMYPDTGGDDTLDDISKYEITINDAPIEKKLRHTYGSVNHFDIKEDLSKLKGDYIEDSQYNKDLIIYENTFTVQNLPSKNSHYKLVYTIPNDSSLTMFGDYNGYEENKNENTKQYFFSLYEGVTIRMNFMGKNDPNLFSNLKIYTNEYQKLEEVTGEFTKLMTTTDTFDSYAFLYYREEYGVSKVDWYNAIQSKIKENTPIRSVSFFDVSHELIRWYEYRLDVPAKSSVINEVTAPLYPDIDQGYEPPTYTFTYLLSPASTWADFSNLNIKIESSMYVIESSLGNFQRSEDGNFSELHFDTLPSGELHFVLSSSESPTRVYGAFDIFIYLIFAGIILICLGIPIGLLIFFGLRSKKVVKNPTDSYRKIRLFYVIEAILAIGLIGIGLFSMIAIPSLVTSILAIALSTVLLGALLFEYLRYKNQNLVRLIITLISFVFYLFGFIGNAYNYEIYEDISAMAIVFGIVIYVVTLVSFARKTKNTELEKKNSAKNTGVGYYPIGYLSSKWLIILWSCMGLWFITFLICGCFYESMGIHMLWLAVIFFVILVIFILGFGVAVGLSNEKDFRTFYKDLDYKTLEQNIFKKLDNPKIHPETKNYILMRLAAIAMVVSLETYKELKNKIFIPENKIYQMEYDALELNYLLTQDEMEKKLIALKKKYSTKNSFKKKMDAFVKRWKAYYSGDVYEPIEQLAPYTTKNEFNNAINLYIQIFYYEHKGKIETSLHLKEEFLRKYSNLKVLVSELEGENIRSNLEEKLDILCPVCGHLVQKHQKYCTECGEKLEEK